MKQLLILVLFSNLCFAQVKTGTYRSKDQNNRLTLTDNNFFSYQDLNGLMKNYLRGEWKIENNQLILMESYHSDIKENNHSLRKTPKFDYKTAQRISFYSINGNQLTLINQEINPKGAKFEAELTNYLILVKD